MSNQPTLRRVARELRRRGLPSPEIARLLEELNDHIEDLLTEQGGSMSELTMSDEQIECRLGRPEVIAAAAVSNR
jgi:hypothetical protein